MSDALRPIAPETLLRERPWVEALARSLVLDDATADDVVQQTWLAALERPPRSESTVRGWLSRVVRNAAFESRRRATRRARWESAATPSAAVPSPEETVAKVEAHRRVVDAVMALDEPFRTAVLLRFFEDLPAAEVARRTGVPVETARSRIKRALVLLRRRLDADHGGDGRSWAIALVPLAGGRGGWLGSAVAGGAVMASTKAVVAAGIVSALLGALVTAELMSSGERGTSDEPPRDPASAVVDATGRGAPPSASRSASDKSSRRAPSRERSVPSVGSSLAEKIDAVRIELPPRTNSPITGHVRTKDGAPVAGAVVRAWAERIVPGARSRPDEPFQMSSLEEAVLNAVAHQQWSDATTRETTTDAAGAYSFSDLVDAAYSVRAWAAGHDIRPSPGSEWTARPGASVEFVASAFVEVPTTVLLPDGSSPEKALVRWTLPAGGGGNSGWWTRQDPVVRIEPDEWMLVAEIGRDLRSTPLQLTAASGQPAEPMTLQLAGRNVITGRLVLDPADSGWGVVRMKARRRDTGATDGKSASARSPDWMFRFDDVEPGEYEVTATLDGLTPAASAVVRVTSGIASQDIAIPRITPSQALTVLVIGPDGSPVPADDLDFTVTEKKGESMSQSGGSQGARQPDGSVRIALRPASWPNSGARYTVGARSKRFGTKEVDFDHGRTERVEIRLDGVAVFEPTMVGAEGKPIASRLRVTLAKRGDPASSVIPGRNRPPEPVTPGDYEALLWIADASGTSGRVVSRVPVQLHAGVNQVQIAVPEFHSLRVRVPGAPKGVNVSLCVARRPERDIAHQAVAVSDAGVAEFPDLPAGLHLVQVSGQTKGSGWSEMLVRVPVSGEVTFVPTTIGGFSVTVDDPNGLMAQSGFRTGDVLLSADEATIDTFYRIDHVLYGARERASIPIEVQRGAERLTLTIDPSKFWARGGYGGAWEPVVR